MKCSDFELGLSRERAVVHHHNHRVKVKHGERKRERVGFWRGVVWALGVGGSLVFGNTPSRSSYEGPGVPAEHQASIVLLDPVPIPTSEQSQ